MPVVVLPESSMPTVTVQTESDDKPSAEANFVGNKNSKVYHKKSCSSAKSMKEANKVGFVTADEAVDEGYKPCGVCLK